MHIYTLRCEMLTYRSLHDTFSVFEDPYNLAKITPAWLKFRVTARERVKMQAGATIDYTIRWLGITVRWKTIIREYEPPFLFVDEQANGPYSLWRHTHRFESTDNGTKIGDTVQYALPFGPLGRLAHALAVRRQLEGVFRYRQQEIGKLLGGRSMPLLEPTVTG